MSEVLQPTERQKEILQGLSSGIVNLWCAEHNYFGPGKGNRFAPAMGCVGCWKVYYFAQLKDVPEGKIQERVEELEAAVHHVVEAVEQGTWDFKPLRHPKIEIEKDAI